jgi:hypothetical protein
MLFPPKKVSHLRREGRWHERHLHTSSQKNLNRNSTIVTKVKDAAIRPLTIQQPLGSLLRGMLTTFMPQMLAISVAGRKIGENIVST